LDKSGWLKPGNTESELKGLWLADRAVLQQQQAAATCLQDGFVERRGGLLCACGCGRRMNPQSKQCARDEMSPWAIDWLFHSMALWACLSHDPSKSSSLESRRSSSSGDLEDDPD